MSCRVGGLCDAEFYYGLVVQSTSFCQLSVEYRALVVQSTSFCQLSVEYRALVSDVVQSTSFCQLSVEFERPRSDGTIRGVLRTRAAAGCQVGNVQPHIVILQVWRFKPISQVQTTAIRTKRRYILELFRLGTSRPTVEYRPRRKMGQFFSSSSKPLEHLLEQVGSISRPVRSPHCPSQRVP